MRAFVVVIPTRNFCLAVSDELCLSAWRHTCLPLESDPKLRISSFWHIQELIFSEFTMSVMKQKVFLFYMQEKSNLK